MKRTGWKRALLLLLVVTSAASATPGDTLWARRALRQQLFFIHYLQQTPPDTPFTSLARLDTFLQRAERAWLRHTPLQEAALRRLSPYVYLLLVASATQFTPLPRPLECHVYRRYMVPAFLANFDDAAPATHPERAHLIAYAPDLEVITSPLLFECALPDFTWQALYQRLQRLPDLIQAYQLRASSDSLLHARLQRTSRLISRRLPLLTLEALRRQQQFGQVFLELAAQASRFTQPRYLRALGHSLWNDLRQRKQTDQALAVLDLLARSLPASELPPDTLRAWYLHTDSTRGLQRFQLFSRAPLPVLLPSERRHTLQGRYLELQQQQEVDISQWQGKWVLLDFWATWCTPCIAQIPKLRALHRQYGDQIVLLSISSDAVTGGAPVDTVRAFMQRHGIDYPVLYDRPDASLTRQFEIFGFPSLLLLNPEGYLMVAAASPGRYMLTLPEVQAFLEQRTRFACGQD
ncbi:TlpA family protein disulfide reductase [Rhodothermus profundi]|uniref:Thiol-disulfide isomerase or thioredoxin n=1 Tax=Rhodothermus profundi TaxID=633813 RepID=A0A1M6U0L8_9BACT|nr:TlpA disulfide reductase family protein [Rhodothermus profundi]SHK62747.1 Thiol-disulfide isomerase or thioredoxin [Rhodothermus profundi]